MEKGEKKGKREEIQGRVANTKSNLRVHIKIHKINSCVCVCVCACFSCLGF